MGAHDKHLPKQKDNKAVKGMGQKDSGRFGSDVAKGQGQTTKLDAKDAKASTKDNEKK
jgi:hypothetical protein